MNPLIGDAAVCPLCGGGNRCQLAAREPVKGPCWCERVVLPADAIRRHPELSGRACLCEACLGALAGCDSGAGGAKALVEGRDYTIEGGAMVWTADYLHRRSVCCRSGCRHCPY